VDARGVYSRALRDLDNLLLNANLYASKNAHKTPHIVDIYTKTWGAPPPTSLAEGEQPPPELFKRTVLSAMISYSYILKVCCNTYKHITVAIVGPAGHGKTTYAVMSAIGSILYIYDDLYRRNIDYGKAVATAAEYTFFDAEKFTEHLKKLLERDTWTPFAVLDDIGSEISKYFHWMGEKRWAYLFSILDQVKERIGVLVLTAREHEAIPKRLREISDYVATVTQRMMPPHHYVEILWYSGRDYGKKRAKPIYIETMPPHTKMPDQVWQAMLARRKEIGIKRIEKVMEGKRGAGRPSTGEDIEDTEEALPEA